MNQYITYLVARNSRPDYITGVCRALSAVATTITVPVHELKPQHILEYLGGLHATLKPTTVALRRGQILAWLNWASREELIQECDWSRRVPTIRTDETPTRALSVEQSRQLLTAVEVAPHTSELAHRRNVAMIYLLLDTGMREGELLRLRIQDVDMHALEVRISSEAKGRRGRSVWFSEETCTMIRKYLRLRNHKPGDRLWVTRFGTCPSKSLILQLTKRYGRVAAIPDLTVHMLRHTALTQMCRTGMILPAVSAIAGHADIRTTERYLHLANTDIRDAAQKHSPIEGFL